MGIPNRVWPGLDAEGRPLAIDTDARARAAGLVKLDMGGSIIFRHSVDAKELEELGQATIVPWPPQPPVAA